MRIFLAYYPFLYICTMNSSISTYSTTTLIATTDSAFTCFASTSKERDEETGYGYFGARYMDHELTTEWLSVDPMSDKYPSISPYAYCAWNPVKLVDENRKEPVLYDLLKVLQVRRNQFSNTFGTGMHYKDGSPKNHQGVDYSAPYGAPIYAVRSGAIVGVSVQGDYGLSLTLEFTQEDGSKAWAFNAHLSSVTMAKGQEVEDGDIIGKTGNNYITAILIYFILFYQDWFITKKLIFITLKKNSKKNSFFLQQNRFSVSK